MMDPGLALAGDAGDLGAFERQVIYQPFGIEDEANDGARDLVGVDRAASSGISLLRPSASRQQQANFSGRCNG